MFLNRLLQIIQKILGITGIIFLSASVIAFIVLTINWRLLYLYSDAEIPPNLITPTVMARISPTPVIIDTNVVSLNDTAIDEILSDNAENQFINYFDTSYNAFSVDWTGDPYEPLKLTLDNFSAENLTKYRNWLDIQNNSKVIPDSLYSIYMTESTISEFRVVVQSAQSDYIKYLQALNVNTQYIDEIQNNTMPISNERISIIQTNKPTDPESGVDYIKNDKGDVVNSDYSRLMMIIYTNDVYKYARLFKNSNVVDFESLTSTQNADKLTRDMAIRYITFKSMSSALQRAVETVNSPEKYKTDKDSYLKANKSLANITNEYQLSWGGLIYTQMNNRTIILRRQADYLSLEVLASVYNLAPNQRTNLYSALYGQYEELGIQLRNLIMSFSTKYSKYPLENIRAKILSDFISKIDTKNINRQILLEINAEFAQIDKYVADYTYLTETESLAMWEYLK